MARGLSAYLTIYNDFDILPHMLRAIAPYVDEIVVVDGAYQWMVPYLQAAGINPDRSGEQVYDTLESSSIKYRVASKIWSSEVEKRTVGYDACRGRYVFRFDADEVPFFDDNELDRFLASEGAVAQMVTPTYINPQWLVALDELGYLPPTPIMFDRTRVDPDTHLRYLWLVLGVDGLPDAAQPFAAHLTSIGVNAHLNEWRNLQSQMRRGIFYWLVYLRQTGVPWIPQLSGKPLSDIGILFEQTPPELFHELVKSSVMLQSQTFRELNWYAVRSPLSRQQESLFVDCFHAMRAGRIELNETIVDIGLTFWPGMPIALDLSFDECADTLTAGDTIRLSTTCELSNVAATQHLLLPGRPWHSATELNCSWDGTNAIIQLPARPQLYSYLRREVDVSLTATETGSLHRFQVIR